MKNIVICAIAKYENDYLVEWVEHHLSIGFDKIYIYDNNDLNDDSVCHILEKYINDGKVILFDVRGKTSMQMKCYNEFYNLYKDLFEYCAFIDLDEFIVFNEKQDIKNIKELLTLFNDADCLHLSWKVYGDNDLIYKQPGTCVERFKIPKDDNFKFCYDFPENMHIKSIVRGGMNNVAFKSNPHIINKKCKCYNAIGELVDSLSPFMNPNYDVCYIKHFYTKTLEEYLKNKMTRKAADINTDIYNLNRFFKYNSINADKIKYLQDNGYNMSVN